MTEKKEKILEAGPKEGTILELDGLRYEITQQYRKIEVEGKEKLFEQKTALYAGDCAFCGTKLNPSNVFGMHDGKPVYISCGGCGGAHNYKKRVMVS